MKLSIDGSWKFIFIILSCLYLQQAPAFTVPSAPNAGISRISGILSRRCQRPNNCVIYTWVGVCMVAAAAAAALFQRSVGRRSCSIRLSATAGESQLPKYKLGTEVIGTVTGLREMTAGTVVDFLIQPIMAKKTVATIPASMAPRQFLPLHKQLLAVGSLTKLFVTATNTDPIQVDIDNPQKHPFEQIEAAELETAAKQVEKVREASALDTQRVATAPPPALNIQSWSQETSDKQASSHYQAPRPGSRRFKTVETMRPPDVPGQHISGTMDESATRDLSMAPDAPALPSGSYMINTIRTGMPIEGRVTAVYEAYALVDTNVYRRGKASTLRKVAGVLHYKDLGDKYSLQSRPEDDRRSAEIVRKGTHLKLFVKQVLANSGKFTLTATQGVTKADIDWEKHLRKQAASARRTQRRLRVHLDALKDREEVPAVVEKISGDRLLLMLQISPTMRIPAFAGLTNLPPHARPVKGLSQDVYETQMSNLFKPGTQLPVRIKSKTAVGVIVDILSTPGQTSAEMAEQAAAMLAERVARVSMRGDRDDDDDDEGDDGYYESFELGDGETDKLLANLGKSSSIQHSAPNNNPTQEEQTDTTRSDEKASEPELMRLPL